MVADRTEMHNRAAIEPMRLADMTTQWEAWARRTLAIPWPWGKPYGTPKVKPNKKKK